jgi:hypothetical protein
MSLFIRTYGSLPRAAAPGRRGIFRDPGDRGNLTKFLQDNRARVRQNLQR